MGRKVIVKLDEDLIKAARERFPELKDVSNVDVVRILMAKALHSKGG